MSIININNKNQYICKHLYQYNNSLKLKDIFDIIDVKGDGLCGFYAYLIATDQTKLKRKYLCSMSEVENICRRLRVFLNDTRNKIVHTQILVYENQKEDMLHRITPRSERGEGIANMELDILHALSVMDNLTLCIYYDNLKKNPWIILNPNCRNIYFIRQTGRHYMVLKLKK